MTFDLFGTLDHLDTVYVSSSYVKIIRPTSGHMKKYVPLSIMNAGYKVTYRPIPIRQRAAPNVHTAL